MSIYQLNTGLSTTQKLELLNSMILELEGLVAQGKFDTNELDQLFTQLYQRKYLRDILLGNTLDTYTSWTHLSAQTGYSIWKNTPDNYSYDVLNSLYFDNKILELRGEASSESLTAFTKVFLYTGSIVVDNTTEAGTEAGTQFNLLEDTNDYLYMGSNAVFNGINFIFHTRGLNYTLKIEYYDNTSGVNAWIELTDDINNLIDETNNFTSNGMISYTAPIGWETYEVNGTTAYWIRISTTTLPSTITKAYVIAPATSVISMLSMSSTQIAQEDWAWCVFDDSIYVTIRNAGQPAYEGISHIVSSSSVTNLKNYFIYNHQYKADYKDNRYTAGLFLKAPASAPADASLSNGQISFWINESTNALTVKVKYSNGTVKSGTVSLT